MTAYLKLIRWPNLLIMAVTMFLVRFYLVMPPLEMVDVALVSDILSFSLLVLAMLLMSAGGYVINDIFDMDIDSVNRADEMIIGKRIKLTTAKLLYWILNLVALGIMIFLSISMSNWQLLIIMLMLAGLLWFYSERYKRQILVGNLVVAFVASAGITIVWLFEFFNLQKDAAVFVEASRAMPLMSGLVFAYVLFAFLSTIVREVVKDIEDMEGDRRFGCRTFPVVYGEVPARNLAAGLLIILIIMIGFWQYILFLKDMKAAFSVLFIALGIGLAALIRLAFADKTEHYATTSALLKLLMLAGILSIVFLNYN
jgi:4-hydroxybenzoate polyprenyltransferase